MITSCKYISVGLHSKSDEVAINYTSIMYMIACLATSRKTAVHLLFRQVYLLKSWMRIVNGINPQLQGNNKRRISLKVVHTEYFFFPAIKWQRRHNKRPLDWVRQSQLYRGQVTIITTIGPKISITFLIPFIQSIHKRCKI